MKFHRRVGVGVCVFFFGVGVGELCGKDDFRQYTDSGSRDIRKHIPPARTRPQDASDTSSVGSPDIYFPPAQTKANFPSDATPMGSSDIYAPAIEPDSKSWGQTLISESPLFTPPVPSSDKSSGDGYSPADYQQKMSSQSVSAKHGYLKKRRPMKVEEIAYSKDNPFVIIGGDLYGLHSMVAAGEIVDILPGKVVIKFGSKKKTYKVNEEIK